MVNLWNLLVRENEQLKIGGEKGMKELQDLIKLCTRGFTVALLCRVLPAKQDENGCTLLLDIDLPLSSKAPIDWLRKWQELALTLSNESSKTIYGFRFSSPFSNKGSIIFKEYFLKFCMHFRRLIWKVLPRRNIYFLGFLIG